MISTSQRMFHGRIQSAMLADQLAAYFSNRQHRVTITAGEKTALVQIGSKHGTPVSVHIADVEGGILVTMGKDRDWLDKVADASELMERASTNPLSLMALLPDAISELKQENLAPIIWNKIYDLLALSRSLAGEDNAPKNPKLCLFCSISNDPNQKDCMACGAPLPEDLPRICPKCARRHTAEALFCQSCGSRLVEG